jgi:hypothetical protein
MHKEKTSIMDRGTIMDFIFKSHIFIRHVSMYAIDSCLNLRLSGICSSIFCGNGGVT